MGPQLVGKGFRQHCAGPVPGHVCLQARLAQTSLPTLPAPLEPVQATTEPSRTHVAGLAATLGEWCVDLRDRDMMDADL